MASAAALQSAYTLIFSLGITLKAPAPPPPSRTPWAQSIGRGFLIAVAMLSLTLSIQFNVIQGALLAWETYVNIAKASEVENIQKWNKQ